MDKNKVVVGLSGGVDSAVAAMLLKRKGFEVIGLTMLPFKDADFAQDATDIARKLNIEHYVVDMSESFKECIIGDFVDEYRHGHTPNPCLLCNPLIKWASMIKCADEKGAFYVATGHYANIACIDGRFTIRNSKSATKDQTYALCNLTQEQLSRTLTPLADYEKEDVRKLAEAEGLKVAHKKDSQDICFIPDGDTQAFLKKYITDSKPGNFIDKAGNVYGPHKGVFNYTIGQRKGLNVAVGHPVFVTGLNTQTGNVTLGESEELFTREFCCDRVNYMGGTADSFPIELMCKIRYAHKGSKCRVSIGDNGLLQCVFEEPVRAITKGQTACFYKDDFVFMGARIV